jgi:hypothetical protein
MVFGRCRKRLVHGTGQVRGQSAVEFALLLPLLLVLALGTADLGRVFVAGIVVESAARDAAEAVANDGRMALLKNPGCDLTCRTGLYGALHTVAVKHACTEALGLPASTDTTGGGICADRLVVSVCIHDHDSAYPQDGDPLCALGVSGSIPRPGCDPIDAIPMSNAQNGPGLSIDGVNSVRAIRTVEVRICYRFEPFIGQLFLPVQASFNFSHIYLNRDRVFPVISDYADK